MPLLSRSRATILKAGPIDNENGLTGWWDFSALGSSTSGRAAVQDISGNGNAGVFSTTNPPQPVLGPYGLPGLLFTPANNVGTVILNADLAATSLLFWYNPTTAVNDTIFSNLAVTRTFQTQSNSTFLIFDGGNRGFTNGPIIGSWNHYAFIYTGSGYNLFTNGVTTETVSASQISVGTFGRNSANNSIDGSLGSVRIYNRALTAAEVNAVYNRDVAGFGAAPDEWQMPTLKSAAFLAAWAMQSNLPVIGTGTF